jgi:SAM-dependent methyltransferase
MRWSNFVRQVLVDPRIRNHKADDLEMLAIHSEIVSSKKLIRSVFLSFYKQMQQCVDDYCLTDGLEIELGSGSGFFKTLRPQLLTSDIRPGSTFDLTIDAQEMNLSDSSVKCFYAINVFHHLPDPDLFFNEIIRVLRPGGVCILIEPHAGCASALLHKHLHKEEIFDVHMESWKNCKLSVRRRDIE